MADANPNPSPSMAKPTNEAEAAAMENAAAEYRAEQAAADLAARRDKVKPLRAFVNSAAFKSVAEKAEELAPDFLAIDGVAVHLQPLPRFMRNLTQAIDAYAPPEETGGA